MAGTFKFHSKLHRASHHSSPSITIPDSNTDPIASQQLPFNGIFYTILTDNAGSFSIPTNSFEWWSTYSTVNTLSGNWANTRSMYTTINTLSNNWNSAYVASTVFRANSAEYESVYTTVSAFSAQWNFPGVMYLGVAQEYTASKTFSGTNLANNDSPLTLSWDLDTNQCTFLTMTNSFVVSNPLNMKKGGTYVLTCLQTSVGGNDAIFDTSYRFNDTPLQSGIIDLTPNRRTVITFVSDGVLMYGDVTKYLE
jgi:hypothetical protein